jgi:tetratricopeptide (TPR) repeat protein
MQVENSRILLRLCALGAALFLPVAALAVPTVRFDLKEGAKLSDVATVIARVAGSADVSKVEFYVDGTLAHTDSSTPYTLDLDTLELKEGTHTLMATAFDSKGKGQATITVQVDNELSKGADFHAAEAMEALKNQDVDKAVRHARRALKISPTNLRAARSLAAIHRQKRELPQAIAVLEAASIPDSDLEARKELVALYVARAGVSDSSEEFAQWAGKASAAYTKMLSAKQVALANTGTGEEGAMQRGDAAFGTREYDAALREYQKCGLKENAPLECVHRLIIAQLASGRERDARYQINALKRAKRADDVTRAIEGYLFLRNREFAKAKETVQEGVDNNVVPSLLVGGYSEIGLGNRRRAAELAAKAYAMAPETPEVLMLRAYTLSDPIDSDKSVLRAMELDPSRPEPYALRAYQTMGGMTNARRFEAADRYFDLALKREPANTFALMGSALSMLGQKRHQEAEPILSQLFQLEKDRRAPDLLVTRALWANMAEKSVVMTQDLEAARKMDSELWGDIIVPEPPELMARVYRYRLPLTLTPGALYPAPRVG